ncbi:hypothetical protein 2 [Wenling crustacean virus 10]|uniref:Uncharacterized protein n=1 Tax=Wenling crustacean virus 10 TaxID=1923479 RepID=A0A1L3KN39_9RHAB|nr:hypothetical protein 2 [Wenling crustacean virus 10]APG78820.1 hypothetical protein 2 [Wenling crustacean virus 10]
MFEQRLLEMIGDMEGSKSLKLGLEELHSRHRELEKALELTTNDEERDHVHTVLQKNLKLLEKVSQDANKDQSKADEPAYLDESDDEESSSDEDEDVPAATPSVEFLQKNAEAALSSYTTMVLEEDWGAAFEREEARQEQILTNSEEQWMKYSDQQSSIPKKEDQKKSKGFRLEDTGAIPKQASSREDKLLTPELFLKAKCVPPMDFGRLKEVLKNCSQNCWDAIIEGYAIGRDSRRDEDLKEVAGGLKKEVVKIEKLLNSYSTTLSNAASYQDKMKVLLDKKIKEATKIEVQQGVSGSGLKTLTKSPSTRQLFVNCYYGMYKSSTTGWDFSSLAAIHHPGFKDFVEHVQGKEDSIKKLLSYDWKVVAKTVWRAKDKDGKIKILSQLGKSADPWFKFMTPLRQPEPVP